MNPTGPMRLASPPPEAAELGASPVLLSEATALRLDARANARLGQLLQRYFRIVFRTLRRLGVSLHSCEDAAQEVFLIVAQKLDAIASGNEKQYLYGVALRVAANRRRAQATRREVPCSDDGESEVSSAPLADSLLEQKRLRELLDRVLDSMPADLRAVFVLTEFEGLSAREISELLELPAGTVASRLRRARELFSEATRNLGPGYSSPGDRS